MDIIRVRLDELWQTLFLPVWSWYTNLEWPLFFAALVLIIFVWLARKALAKLLIFATSIVANAIGVSVGDTIKHSMLPAFKALVVVIGLFGAMKIVNPPKVVADILLQVFGSVLVAAIFAAIYALINPLTKSLEIYRTEQSSLQLDWIIRGARVIVAFIGFAAVLKIWGIDLGPILTGMGVVGAAVALASQDLLRNLLAGLTSMGEKRFRAGEWIRVEGIVEGTVEEVDFRSTLIKRFDLAPVYVPNAQLADVALTNFSRMEHRRIYWKISIMHSATTQQLGMIKNGIERYVESCGDFTDPSVARRLVRIDLISDSSIDMLIHCFTVSSDYLEYQNAKENLVMAVREVVESSGSRFAYPSQSIYMEINADEKAASGMP